MEGAEVMVIDVDEKPGINGPEELNKGLKRKRGSISSRSRYFGLRSDEKNAQIEELEREMEGLFGYYRQVMEEKAGFGLGLDLGSSECGSLNGVVGLLMEESDLSLSGLVEEVHGKLVGAKVNATVAVVKATVLFVGQRVMYGVPNVDADVLEDESQACLWCWETRDLKLLPKALHGALKIRRTCRKKIQERVTAVSAMITALRKAEADQDYENGLIKASEKLVKVLREADIRLLVDSRLLKKDTEMAGKEIKREEKLLIKQMEKTIREAEKEKKKMDFELQKEKRRMEKEQKRKQEEAEKDVKRREKEKYEMQIQLRKQQDEAEKEQRRREKEEAELKKKAAIQKQASIMERFLKKCQTISPSQNESACNENACSEATTSDLPSKKVEKMPEAVTVSIDYTLSSNGDIATADMLRSHLSSWHYLGRCIRSSHRQHWSLRRKPKIELFKELKLTSTRELAPDEDSSVEKLANNWGEVTSDERSSLANSESLSTIKKLKQRKQFFQFDKSHRPAFYGIWPKKSHVVGPRHPFKKDPYLDYDVDSDEEWEEEEPGESLSDCDKDDEEESLEEGCLRADDEEASDDGFFVPDGYFSENEGVQIDKMETDLPGDEARFSPSCKLDHENGEFSALLQQQKHLVSLTDKALRKNQPLIILNLMHEKDLVLMTEDRIGTSELERMCLQVLSMWAFPGVPPLEISIDHMLSEDQDHHLSNGKTNTAPISHMTALESDMSAVVSAIEAHSQSLGKVVDSLQQKFPSVSKTQLRNKVREISEFVDNRWMVKKEILHEVGLSISPVKRAGKMQNISSFFSKRCLPPADKGVSPVEICAQPFQKQDSIREE